MAVHLTLQECCEVQRLRLNDPNVVQLCVQDTPGAKPTQRKIESMSQHITLQAGLLLESGLQAKKGKYIDRHLPTLQSFAILEDEELVGITDRMRAAGIVIGPFVMPIISAQQIRVQNWVTGNIANVYDTASEAMPEDMIDLNLVTRLGIIKALNTEIRSAVLNKELTRLRFAKDHLWQTFAFSGTREDPIVREG